MFGICSAEPCSAEALPVMPQPSMARLYMCSPQPSMAWHYRGCSLPSMAWLYLALPGFQGLAYSMPSFFSL